MSDKTISANLVDEIILVNEDGSCALFGTDPARYVVPVCQRAFAWGSDNRGKKQNEILQLMDDVLAAEGTYYLGSLVVSRCRKEECGGPDVYEVIDGQQRLTALYLIFACLGLGVKAGSLGYACREASQSFLENLAEWPGDGDPGWLSNVNDEKDSTGIQRGVRAVLEKLHAENGEQGVEQYKKPIWHKIVSAAAALALVAGLGAGGYMLARNKGADNHFAGGENSQVQEAAETGRVLLTMVGMG